MTDPAMARLMLEGPKELKAITVNGQIIVETDDDRERWEKVFIDFSHHNCSQEKSREGSQKEIQVKLILETAPKSKKKNFLPPIIPDGTLVATTRARSTLPRECRLL